MATNNTTGSLSPFTTRTTYPYKNVFNDNDVFSSDIPNTTTSPNFHPFPCSGSTNPNISVPAMPLDTTMVANITYLPDTGTYTNSLALWLKKEAAYKELIEDTTTTLNTTLQSFEDSIALTNLGELEEVESKVREEDLVVAKTKNDAILPSNTIESTSKEVFTLLITSLIEGKTADELSTGAVDSLRYIAYLCPFTHGRAVYSARAICTYLDTAFVDYHNYCENFYSGSGSARKAAPAKEAAFSIYPNPAKEFINIETLTEGRLIITNTLGQIVGEYELSNEQINEININHLKNGLYICKLIDANNVLIDSKHLDIIK